MASLKLVRKCFRIIKKLKPSPFNKVYRRFQNFTMIPKESYLANLALAARISHVQGCVVECGVWKGGMIAGMGAVLGSGRKYYLFDSFEGLPLAKEIDGKGALAWQQDKESPVYYDNCRAAREVATEAMKLANIADFELIAGWFNETTPAHRHGEPIALLRLDGDWYDSTMVCLENLFDRIVSGGIIIIDDYHTWDGCSRAVHDFLSRRSAVERINCHKGVCYLIKRKIE